MLLALLTVLSCRKPTGFVPESGWNVLSNPDEIVFSQSASETGLAFSVTAAETYEAVLADDGLDQLLDIVDGALLSAELEEITSDDLTARMNKLMDNESLPPIFQTGNSMLANWIFVMRQFVTAYPTPDGHDGQIALSIARERYTTTSTDSGPNPNASQIAIAMAALRSEYGFTINDRFLAAQYRARYVSSAAGDEANLSVLASLTGTPDQPEKEFTVTPDAFLTSVLASNCVPYILRAAERKVLLDPVYFTPVFGEETDLQKNDFSRMQSLRDQTAAILADYETIDDLDGDPLSFFPYGGYDEYLFDVYGVRSADDLLEALVVETLKNAMTAGRVIDQLGMLRSQIIDRQNLSFDLVADMLVFDIDANGNGIADDAYDVYRSMLSESGQAQVLIELENELKTAVDAYFAAHPDHDIRALFAVYQAADADDPVFGAFIEFGFRAAIRPLRAFNSSSENDRIAYFGPNGMENQFNYGTLSRIRTLYQTLMTDPRPIVARTPCFSMEDGVAVIEGSDAEAIAFPTFRFAETDAGHPVYAVGSANAADLVTEAQLSLYLERYLAQRLFGMTPETEAALEAELGKLIADLPPGVLAACDFFVRSSLDLVFANDLYRSGIAQECVGGSVITGTYVDAVDEEWTARFEGFVEVYQWLYYNVPVGDGVWS
ncbi:MAG: hypothetical protein A2Y16_06645 [Tenericutes bacterium GWF2_57_13]|nr:MAG: hypothetical protein A2Y16_06645 [Tenericutes bacterium GWF2_57_13]